MKTNDNRYAVPLTDFLLQIPYDKSEYCYYIEDASYYRVLHLLELKERGVSIIAINELQSEFRLNLPTKVRIDYPNFTSMQVEITCQLILDGIEDEIYIDCLFASLNSATARLLGKELLTEKNGLQLLAVQMN